MKTVVAPPDSQPDASGFVSGGWWHTAQEPGRIICDLCPRECSLKPGDRGFCFVRQNIDGDMKLTTFGRSTGFCIDPIEKKPLNHFHPGTAVLSFGTAGCNLGCQFCQNWDISKSREVERLSELALPEMIAAAAVQTGCRSVAYTYNDPIIWAEYAIETAKACRTAGIKSVAVTAGYIMPEARPTFFHAMDAANVDLKAFTEDFYRKITYSKLAPVLETLRWLKHESDVWFEITNLLIPDANDSPDEIRRMCDWILQAVGSDVPIHFSAFHPDFRMMDRDRTPHEALLQARQIALQQGLKFAYVGNVDDVVHQSTWCPGCGELLIERNCYELGRYQLQNNRCGACGIEIAGHFDTQPGTWGRRRLPVRIGNYQTAAPELVSLRINSAKQTESNINDRNQTMEAVRDKPRLTSEQETRIHQAACEIVAATVTNRAIVLPDVTLGNAADTTVMGVFVTVKRGQQLRGCCGTLGQPMKLMTALAQAAKRTARDDHRFPPVSATELPYLTLDVTVLFNFEDVTEQGEDRINAVEVGTHGLKIVRGQQSGLLLPVVAIERNWDARTFLDQVCRKAGLPITAWQQPDSQLVRFEGRMIEHDFDAAAIQKAETFRSHPVTQAEVETLAAFARGNIRALFQGAVPSCFPANCPDVTVDGIALRLTFPAIDQSLILSQLQFRNGYPLQTTLLKLTESAANWLRNAQATSQVISTMQVDLILFADAAMHGVLQSVDARGIDPRDRAVLVLEGQRSAWIFSRNRSTDELIKATPEAAKVSMPASAQVFSLAAVSSAADFRYANVSQAQSGPEIRPPAVAGKFYPSSPPALAAIVHRCLKDIPVEKEVWPAVMVPHAGLQYSGRIAGDVLKRIQIPDTVLIIGPKHTRHGVDWAVAPHATWRLPNATIASDTDLAQRLSERIDGLEPDAAAHAQEHCIEVELPLLQALAPNSKVVGIAIGGGNLERGLTFGRQLADVLSELPVPPLLVISSDMNHFASDPENRRLDEMALAAMETLDPAKLYETVTSNSISMCGILPAVIVMEALRRLGRLSRLQRVGYATSAEVSGDASRVVGYAGLLLG
ncbi:MAG: AmmeMemoRadiSam system radical SAM enzyme [Planctomycetaceae bacterium]